MSTHVLLNLNMFGERDKILGFPSILSLSSNEFDKFNNTGARMLDSIYQMALKFQDFVQCDNGCHYITSLNL